MGRNIFFPAEILGVPNNSSYFLKAWVSKKICQNREILGVLKKNLFPEPCASYLKHGLGGSVISWLRFALSALHSVRVPVRFPALLAACAVACRSGSFPAFLLVLPCCLRLPWGVRRSREAAGAVLHTAGPPALITLSGSRLPRVAHKVADD